MNILIKIRSLINELPQMEQKVAEYILRYSERVPYETVNEIARNANVSVPSITRLTKRLGFKSFKDLKVDIAVSGVQSSTVNGALSKISKDDTDAEVSDKVFFNHIKSLEDTLSILKKSEISEFSRLCSATSRLIFIGLGSSGFICDEAALRLSHLDIRAEAYNETVSILLHSSRLKKGQICVGISHSGKTSLVGEGLRAAKEQGATTALITNYIKTPFEEYCDYVFFTSFVENSLKSATVSSRLAQLAVIDVIYLLAAKKKRNISDFNDLNTIIERTLRIK